jgi:tetratricopeptide (TPR) repeat protein
MEARKLTESGRRLSWSFNETGDQGILDQAIAVMERACALTPHDNTDNRLHFSTLGNTLLMRYDTCDRAQDLDRCIEAYRRAVPFFAANDPERIATMSTLVMALGLRFNQHGRAEDLTDAVLAAREVKSATHRDDENYAARMQPVFSILLEHSQRTNDVQGLDEAIAKCVEAATCMSDDSPFAHAILGTLGNAYRARFARNTSSISDVEDARAAYERALEAPADARTRGMTLINLSTACLDQHSRTHDPADLQRGLDVLHEALTLVPVGGAEQSLVLTNLGGVYTRRYEATGSLPDLERAIDLQRQARDGAPAYRRALICNNLAGALYTVAERRHSQAELDEAIGAYRQAIELASDAERPGFLNGLANALSLASRSEFGESEHTYFDEAIAHAELAVALTPPEAAGLPSRLHNYGNRLIDRYMAPAVEADPTDLKRGLASIEQAIRLAGPDSAATPVFLNSYATALRELPDKSLEHYHRARALYRQACRKGLRNNPSSAFTAGQNWGTWALTEGRWRDAVMGLHFAMQAIERLLGAQWLRADKEAWLRRAQKVPANYAYALARRGRLAEAVSALEGARTRLLSDSLERLRADLMRLPKLGHAALLDRYRNATAALDAATAREFDHATVNGENAAIAAAARLELDEVVARIRELPGLQDFFRTPTLSSVHAVLSPNANTAGLYLLSTPAGSLALLLHAGMIEPLWLDFSAAALHDAMYAPGSGLLMPQVMPAGSPAGALTNALNHVLPIVGQHVVAPIADILRARLDVNGGGVDREPGTLIVIATVSWSLVPLQAAPYNDSRRCLLDDFVVRYTPSARALMHAERGRADSHHGLNRFVGVCDPQPAPEGSALPAAREEVNGIAALFGARARVLSGEDATPTNVLRALADTDYLHLACHGVFDALRPLDSGLVLSGGMLTAQALIATPLETAPRLVVLSACQTALTDPFTLPEEALGLPAMFLQAGSAGVIGSLWSVADDSTAQLMREFYRRHLTRDGGEPLASAAHAFRAAQLWLRDSTHYGALDHWAAFTYHGSDLS